MTIRRWATFYPTPLSESAPRVAARVSGASVPPEARAPKPQGFQCACKFCGYHQHTADCIARRATAIYDARSVLAEPTVTPLPPAAPTDRPSITWHTEAAPTDRPSITWHTEAAWTRADWVGARTNKPYLCTPCLDAEAKPEAGEMPEGWERRGEVWTRAGRLAVVRMPDCTWCWYDTRTGPCVKNFHTPRAAALAADAWLAKQAKP